MISYWFLLNIVSKEGHFRTCDKIFSFVSLQTHLMRNEYFTKLLTVRGLYQNRTSFTDREAAFLNRLSISYSVGK